MTNIEKMLTHVLLFLDCCIKSIIFHIVCIVTLPQKNMKFVITLPLGEFNNYLKKIFVFILLSQII